MIVFSPATLSYCLALAVSLMSFNSVSSEPSQPHHPPEACAAKALAPLGQEETSFIRYSKGRKIQRLETAMVQYRSDDADLEITLVSAVHIADAAYYRILQKKLDAFPYVLYQGLKEDPEETNEDLLTLLDRLQGQLQDYLALEAKAKRISTEKDHFIQADLSAKEIQVRLKEAKVPLVPAPDIVQSMGPLVGRMLKALAPDKKAEPSAFLNKLRIRAKRWIAKALGDGSSYYRRFKRREEEKRDAVIIEARNKHALGLLDGLIETKNPRKIAIFYGAGHMLDFETRLKKRFPDLSLRKVEWLAAWTIGGPPPAKKEPKKPAEAPAGKKI